MSKIDPKKLQYEGCDLEAMAKAPNYYQWLLSIVRPYLGKSIVEVGAGSGSFSEELVKFSDGKITLIEPSKNMYKLLAEKLPSLNSGKNKVKAINGYLDNSKSKLSKIHIDTFIYINVFEHIEFDHHELETVKKLIEKSGHVIIFVPAHMQLFTKFDERIGHFRRYTKNSMRDLAGSSGLEIVELRYVDMFGTLPWIINFKILNKTSLNPKMVKVYDTVFIPVIKICESIMRPFFGKNILMVVKKK